MIPVSIQNVSDTKITVTDTATLVYDLIDTASSTKNAQKYYDDQNVNALFIQPEDGDIRYLFGTSPAATEGILIKKGNKEYIPGATELEHGIMGSGKKSLGGNERAKEIILKQNEDYTLRIIATVAGYVNYDLEFYEHTDKN